MARTVKGITLTPEERRQAGYDKEKTAAHTCSVALANGAPCEVSYTRTSARVHAFAFGTPLCRTQYAYEAIPGGVPGIEAKAAALAECLFHQAQKQEQTAMRQKTPASRATRHGDGGPQISARHVEQLAGLYAACVRCASGNLIRVGGTYAAPEGALKEVRDGRHGAIRLLNGQRLVVGICNRAAQRWEEPAFLAGERPGKVPGEPASDTAGDQAEGWEEGNGDYETAVGNQEGDPVGQGGSYDE